MFEHWHCKSLSVQYFISVRLRKLHCLQLRIDTLSQTWLIVIRRASVRSTLDINEMMEVNLKRKDTDWGNTEKQRTLLSTCTMWTSKTRFLSGKCLWEEVLWGSTVGSFWVELPSIHWGWKFISLNFCFLNSRSKLILLNTSVVCGERRAPYRVTAVL